MKNEKPFASPFHSLGMKVLGVFILALAFLTTVPWLVGQGATHTVLFYQDFEFDDLGRMIWPVRGMDIYKDGALFYSERFTEPPAGWSKGWCHVVRSPSWIPFLPHGFVVRWANFDENDVAQYGRVFPGKSGWLIAIPHWAIFTMFVVLGGVLSRIAWKRHTVDGCCVICGYDLRSSPHQCPECGAANPNLNGRTCKS